MALKLLALQPAPAPSQRANSDQSHQQPGASDRTRAGHFPTGVQGRAKLTDCACCGANSPLRGGPTRISVNHGPEPDSGHGWGMSRPESRGAPSRQTALVVLLTPSCAAGRLGSVSTMVWGRAADTGRPESRGLGAPS